MKRLRTVAGEIAHEEIVASVQRRFDFGEADLAANRHGEFTARQRAPLKRRLRGQDS